MPKSDTPPPVGAQSSGETVFASIPTSRRGDELRIGFTKFKGKDYVMVRTWYQGDGDEMLLGKGINVPISMLPDIAEAINKAHDAARQNGLLR